MGPAWAVPHTGLPGTTGPPGLQPFLRPLQPPCLSKVPWKGPTRPPLVKPRSFCLLGTTGHCLLHLFYQLGSRSQTQYKDLFNQSRDLQLAIKTTTTNVNGL